MRKLLLVLILIIFISNVSAQNISFSYPEEVYIGEEFTVKVGLINFLEGNYDIKFDTSKSGGNLLKILNNGQWRSNYYYVIGAISNNEEKEFTLKVEEYVGTIIIIIKTRLSNSVESFGDYEIESLEASQEETSKESSKSQQEENAIEEKDDGQNQSEQPEERETIILNPQVIKSENDNENLSKSNYAIYGLVFFCVLLVVLFILRKNKYNKNEFR